MRQRYYKVKPKKRKDGFFTKLINGVITLSLTGVMLWGLQACSGANSTTLKFAQLSDVHFLEDGTNTTFKMTGQSPALLDDAITQINNETDIDFTMITGDLIDKPFEKELKAVIPHLNNLNAPWYFTFGNHDRCVGGYLDTLVYLDMLRNGNPNFQFKKPYYSFVPKKGFKVIVIDDIISDKITSNGFVDEAQLKWLKKELDSSKNDTVLIFMHVPITEPFASPNHRLKNDTEVKNLLKQYKNPIGVFQGHYHASRISQQDNILFVNSPALVSYPNAFRIVTVTNSKDSVEFNLKWVETNEKTIQKMAKILVFSGSIYAGEEKDQSGIFVIKK